MSSFSTHRFLLNSGPAQVIRGSHVTLGFQKGNDLIVCRWKDCYRKYVGVDSGEGVVNDGSNTMHTFDLISHLGEWAKIPTGTSLQLLGRLENHPNM